MKRLARGLFVWSWILTLPVTILGGYWIYHTFDRFYTFSVRYDASPFQPQLHEFGLYEFRSLMNKINVTAKGFMGWQSTLKTIHLFVPESELSLLESRMPQSGFKYVKGRIMVNGGFIKTKVRYRGDFLYHWAYHKKSIRIKTSKGKLFQGIRDFNLQAPKFPEQLNNFLAFRLAKKMGLLAPRTELVRLFLNEEDMGIHIFIEQLKEMMLRHNGLMPADIYRGEIMGPKDGYLDSGVGSLFETAEVWDKVSVNNHYPPESKVPLDTFLRLIRNKQLAEAQKALGDILDLEAWGKFSAFEALAQTHHFHRNHNYRLYYDPWREKIIPIVWDPIGWNPDWKAKPGQRVPSEIVKHGLQTALFMNGDFQRARYRALEEFFNSEQDQEFLKLVSKSIAVMEREIPMDPLLRPADPEAVILAMRDMEERIRKGFADIKEETWSGPPTQYHFGEGVLNLSVQGDHPVWRLRLMFDKWISQLPQVWITYRTPTGTKKVSVSDEVQLEGSMVTVNAGFLPNLKTTHHGPRGRVIQYAKLPGDYEVTLDNLEKSLRLISVRVDRGKGWEEAVASAPLQLTPFETLYAPVSEQVARTPLVWSGDIVIKDVRNIKRPLIIKPGTKILMRPGASLILEGRLLAQGTAENPIRFLPAAASQAPWGTVVLKGHGSDGSLLTHCEMEGGSGLKGDLFEYSAMLSIHDVKKVTVSDCLFRNNGIVDDMVHVVYSDIRLVRSKFIGAFSDALDLDISEAVILNCRFEKSGNDGIDLMATKAFVLNSVFLNNGDKGISVGEGSDMLGVNNHMTGNGIAVQSKDQSIALLFNQTLAGNKKALDAYKKNWRYGGGGVILVSKSRIESNTENVTADKHSKIQIFDTFVDKSLPRSNIVFLAVDGVEKRAAAKNNLLPVENQLFPEIARSSRLFEKEYLKHTNPHKRGARL